MGAVARLSGLIILSKPFDHQLGLLYHILLVFEPHEAGGLVYGDPPALVDLIVVVLDPAGCVFHEEEIDYLEDPFRALHVLEGKEILDVAELLYYAPLEAGLLPHLPVRCPGEVLALFSRALWQAPDLAALGRDEGDLDPAGPPDNDPSRRYLPLLPHHALPASVFSSTLAAGSNPLVARLS